VQYISMILLLLPVPKPLVCVKSRALNKVTPALVIFPRSRVNGNPTADRGGVEANITETARKYREIRLAKRKTGGWEQGDGGSYPELVEREEDDGDWLVDCCV
jgi:hypothetical protein